MMRNSHKEPVHQQRAQTSHDIRFRKELRALELHLPTLSGHVEESSDSWAGHRAEASESSWGALCLRSVSGSPPSEGAAWRSGASQSARQSARYGVVQGEVTTDGETGGSGSSKKLSSTALTIELAG